MAPEATARVTSPTQQSSRASMASRLTVKQEEDGQRRQQPATKAWGSGVNPITQKYSSLSQSNGTMNKGASKPAGPDSPGSSDKAGADNHNTVLAQAMGQLCTINLKEGAIFVGVLAAVKAKQADTLLLCRMVRAGTQNDVKGPQKSASQSKYVGHGPEHIMVFNSSHVASIVPSALSKVTRAQTGKGFMTDAQISGNAGFKERKLERWQPPADSSLALGSSDNTGEWDQFKVNKEKFGVKSDYHEDHYTTPINKNSPLYAMREKNAARIAAEIEGDSKSNTYSEQRGINDEGYDEEDLHSGVRREPVPLPSGQPDRYIPPSRRTQPPSTTGGNKDDLGDPAIISAQARREPAKETKQNQTTEAVATATPSQIREKVASLKEATALPASTPTGPSAANSSSKVVPTPVQTQAQIGLGSTSRGLPADVRTAVKNFVNMEKLKVQDSKRRQASHDKALKVNDLKKFAINFKLNTPVPKDLLPILAKDEIKQNEIVKKAQEQVEITKQTKLSTDQKQSADGAAQSKRQSESAASGAPTARPAISNSQTSTPASNGLTQRLEKTRNMHKSNQGAMQMPSPIPDRTIRAGSVPGPPQNALTSPVRANARNNIPAVGPKLSGKAIEFKPNAMAMPFKPGGTTNVSSPSTKPATTRPITPNMPQPRFLREAKARDARGIKAQPIQAQLKAVNTIKAREVKQRETGQETAAPSKDKETTPPKLAPPFKERVDWLDGSNDGKEHLLPGYKDQFAHKARSSRQMAPPVSPSNVNRGQHPMSYAGPGGHPGMHPMQMGQQMPPQMHPPPPPPHFAPTGPYDDHHMRPGVQPYAAPSPRPPSVYPSPMPHAAQMSYPQGSYMAPGPHGMPPRQYSNGPAGMSTPHMQPPMMMPQNSQGPYMQQHMVPMQPGAPYQVHQAMYSVPPQPSVYPSPGRGAPPMMQSGSHQGPGAAYPSNGQYTQPMYHHPPGPMPPRGSFNGQQHYSQSPYQQQQYPARTPSHGYTQPHQTPVAPAQASPTQPAISGADEAK